MALATPTPSSSPWRPRRWLVRWPPSAWNVVKARPHVLHTNSPSPDVATTLPRRVLFMAGALAESADVVEDDVEESVLSESASNNTSFSLARLIPAPMDGFAARVNDLLEPRVDFDG